jgi:very-short-patch-repair endonuclease
LELFKQKPLGFRFGRQHTSTVYILDFYCYQLKPAMEVDSSIHKLEEVKENDVVRQGQLEKEGIIYLWFSNDEKILKPKEIIHQIETFLKKPFENK